MSFGLASTAHSSIHPPSSPLYTVHSANPHAYASPSSSSSSALHPALAHAASASSDGTLLGRTVDNGLSLELSSLGMSSSSMASGFDPLRLAFPAPLARAPTLHLTGTNLVVLALTATGFLYRLMLPAESAERKRYLDDQASSSSDSDDWVVEHPVRALISDGASGQHEPNALGTVEAVDDECLLVGLKTGVLLRLDWDGSVSSWSETSLKPSSYLSSLSSLIPFSSASPSTYTPSSIHSLAVLRSDAFVDAGSVVALSLTADRRMRVWNVLAGSCARTLDLPSGDLLAQQTAGEGGFVRLLGSRGGQSTSGGLEVARRTGSGAREAFADYAVVYAPSQFLVFGLRSSNANVGGAGVPDLVPCLAVPAPQPTAAAALRTFALVPSPAGARLWTAWDAQTGTAEVHTVDLAFDGRGGVSISRGGWQEATTTVEPVPTAAFFADRLFFQQQQDEDPPAPSAIAAVFLAHLFHPGRFAQSSLSSALEGYLSTVLSLLPPSISAHPDALGRSYPSLPERFAGVVGAHLQVEVDERTGARKERAHAERLVEEWLGVLARADEAERGARWAVGGVVVPASLEEGDAAEDQGTWAVVRRDGLVVPFARCGPAEQAYAALPLTAESEVSPILAHGHAVLAALPPAVVNLVRREVGQLAAGSGSAASVSVEECVLDLWQAVVEPSIDPSMVNLIEAAVRHLGGCEGVVRKAEEMLSLVGNNGSTNGADGETDGVLSILGAAVLSSALLQTLEARERYAISIILFLAGALALTPEDDERSAVQLARAAARAIGVWREVGAGEWVGRVGVLPAPAAEGGPVEWVERFGGLKVGNSSASGAGQAALLPPPSVLATLLLAASPRLPTPATLEHATRAFLRSAFPSIGRPDDRTTALKLIDRVLSVGQYERALELTDQWDEDSGMGYVRGKAALALGRIDESERLFERAAGVFDGPSTDAPLKAVLPAGVGAAWSLTAYYRHVSLLFAHPPGGAHHQHQRPSEASIVRFCNLAIAAAADAAPTKQHQQQESTMDVDDDDEDKENAGARSASTTKDLWTRLFAATVALGRYEDAYMVLVANPHRDTINDAVSHLITHMCHANQVARLVQFSFVGLQDVVERTLAFKARHSDPMAFPSYPMVLYSWHIHRGDYRSAALAIYAQARRLGEAHGPFAEVSARRAKSYLLAINALALVDPKHAWLAMPVAVDPTGKRRKRTKTTANIPEELFSKAARARDVEIVDLDDIRRERDVVGPIRIVGQKN